MDANTKAMRILITVLGKVLAETNEKNLVKMKSLIQQQYDLLANDTMTMRALEGLAGESGVQIQSKT